MTVSSKGFTLLELLFAVAIVSFIATIFIRPFSHFQKEQILRKETDIVAALLEKARVNTLASINNKQYGVHFATSSATLFEGTAFSSGGSGNEIHALDSLVTVNTALFQGGGSDVVFKKRTGETDFYGSVSLRIAGSVASSSIIIERTGLIGVR